ncbi:hypothetical protein CPC08DRAFT_124297 [Agrocybe pediades]|nr:hypothetical protein CPC08DRAFT_124297 [Agrocybe pediades]
MDHPSKLLNDFLWTNLGREYPDAQVVITEDNDWISVLQEDDFTLPDVEELYRRITKPGVDMAENPSAEFLARSFATRPSPPETGYERLLGNAAVTAFHDSVHIVDAPSTSSRRGQKTDSTKANWFETSVNGGVLLLGVLQDAAGLAPVPYLKQAAGVTLKIIEAVQQLKDNKAAFRRLAQDATELIATIFDRYKNSPDQASWPPPEIAQIISELLGTLTEILKFVQDQVHKNRAIRLINSKADVGKVKEYRERLQAALEKFQIHSLNESVSLILLNKLNQQEQQAGSHPTLFEEASEVQAKIEADCRRKKEVDAKAAEERRQKEIEAKQREVAESFENIRRAEAEAQEYQKVYDEVRWLRVESELLRSRQDLSRQQAELDEQLQQLAAEEEARKEYAGRRWSSTTPIRADSAGSGSTNADDPVVLDQTYKRYEEREQSYLSKLNRARKGSHSKKSSASTPQAQHHPFQQPPVSPPAPEIEDILVAHLVRFGLGLTAGQPPPSPPPSLPPSPPPPYPNPASPPPGTVMYNSGNYLNNTISNVGNNDSRTVITPRPRRATRRTGS